MLKEKINCNNEKIADLREIEETIKFYRDNY